MKTNKLFCTQLLLASLLTACSNSQQNPTTNEPDENGTTFYDASLAQKSDDKKHQKKEAAAYELDGNFTHSNHKGKTYHHKNYSLSYSEEDEQSEWVSYELTRNETKGDEERADLFSQDPIITTGSAQPYEYRNSGYDKGHLAPAADMRFDETAMNECFYMSNISPQIKEMNRGVWNDLEVQSRQWARRFGRIYVVCGPVLNQPNSKKKRLSYDDKYKGRTETRITIPDYFYKIIFDFSKKGKEKMIAFCIPNREVEDSFRNYAVTVDSIEEMTGIDFFNNLPTAVQAQYESSIDLDKWR